MVTERGILSGEAAQLPLYEQDTAGVDLKGTALLFWGYMLAVSSL
jgi:hypothetical protein